jgi:hypothetical protein
MLRFERATSAPMRLEISVEVSDSSESGGAKIDRLRDASANMNVGSTAIRSRGLFAKPPIIVFIRDQVDRSHPSLIMVLTQSRGK